jgi:aminoglycoside phosphotransferase (APT) family kinase protein
VSDGSAAALDLEPLRLHLDRAGLGTGPLHAEPIGDGHSNLTFLIERTDARLVLRRPPLGPLPPRAHDVLREARLLIALGAVGQHVPKILDTCEDEAVIGAPFYLMSFVEGEIVTDELPAAYDQSEAPGVIAEHLVETLIEVHGIDLDPAGLRDFGRPLRYLERQLERFSGQLQADPVRELPALERIAEWLGAHLPPSQEPTLVHGDFRLGNVMLDRTEPRVVAVLDWEMATLGDPLADLGYLTAMWAEPEDGEDPMLELSRVTRLPGFPPREHLAEIYGERTGRSLSNLSWYQVLAIWKAAIFLEGSYRRFVAGTTVDPFFARLDDGVPALAARAEALIAATRQ